MNKYIFFQIFLKYRKVSLFSSFFHEISLLSEEVFADSSWVEAQLSHLGTDLVQIWNHAINEKTFLQRHYRWLQENSVHVVVRGDWNYPSCFEHLEDPPWILYYQGQIQVLNANNLSVVGSRLFGEVTRQWIDQELFSFLKKQSVPVVSGGARGVDFESHLLALRLNLPTTVILPSGLGQMYPEHLHEMKEEILEKQGLILSEFPWNAPMHKSYFHHRNRLIAAAGRATLIVQAQKRSGTMITAHQCARIGKPVWCVPGHPKDPFFSGNLQLLNEGATLVSDAHELSALWQSEVQDFLDERLGVE